MKINLRSGKEVETRPYVPSSDSEDDSGSEGDLVDIFADDRENEADPLPFAAELDSRNPLLNPVVLKNLFELCQLEDLRRFRLVCKLWLDVSLPRWRADMIIEIMPPPGNNSEYEDSCLLNWNTIHNLYNDGYIDDIPFRKFKLRDWTYPKTNREGKLNWDQFWRVCGPWMHFLHLSAPTFPTERQMVKVILEMTPNLHTLKLTRMPAFALKYIPAKIHPNLNLRSLTVSSFFEWSWRRGEVPIPWRQLFRIFPNLEELECLQLEEANYVGLADSIDELNLSSDRKRGRKLVVKINGVQTDRDSFADEGNRRIAVLQRLIELPQLKIRLLDLTLARDVVDPSFFPRLFELHGDTMTELLLSSEHSFDEVKNIIAPPYLYLTNLSKLEFGYDTFPDFHFLEHAPNLKVMLMDKVGLHDMLEATDISRLENVSIQNLHELQITVSRYGYRVREELSESEMSLLVKWMPNVRNFTGELSKGSFRVVCENWRELRELDIIGADGIDDEAITGVEDGMETRFPNVTSLKRLRRFKGSQLRVSEDSIWNGFMQLDYIYWLEAELSGRVSDKAFIALFKKCPTPFLWRRESKLKEKRKVNKKVKARALKLSNEFGIGYEAQADSEDPWPILV